MFADLGFPDAKERQEKLRLAYALNQLLDKRETAAAEALGFTLLQREALKNYRLSGFTTRSLAEMLDAIGSASG